MDATVYNFAAAGAMDHVFPNNFIVILTVMAARSALQQIVLYAGALEALTSHAQHLMGVLACNFAAAEYLAAAQLTSSSAILTATEQTNAAPLIALHARALLNGTVVAILPVQEDSKQEPALILMTVVQQTASPLNPEAAEVVEEEALVEAAVQAVQPVGPHAVRNGSALTGEHATAED